MEEIFDMKKLVKQTDKEIEKLAKNTNMIAFFEQFNSRFSNYYMKHGKYGNLHPSFEEKESYQSLKNKSNV
jgi:hypothetical protein